MHTEQLDAWLESFLFKYFSVARMDGFMSGRGERQVLITSQSVVRQQQLMCVNVEKSMCDPSSMKMWFGFVSHHWKMSFSPIWQGKTFSLMMTRTTKSKRKPKNKGRKKAKEKKRIKPTKEKRKWYKNRTNISKTALKWQRDGGGVESGKNVSFGLSSILCHAIAIAGSRQEKEPWKGMKWKEK